MKKALIAAGVFALNAFTVIGFYMGFKDFKKAVFWSLPILICCLVIVIGSLCFQLSALKSEINSKEQIIFNTSAENKALEEEKAALEKQIESLKLQNKNQRKKISFIEDHWKELDSLFVTTLQKSKTDRFEEAYKLYLYKTNILFNDDKEVF